MERLLTVKSSSRPYKIRRGWLNIMISLCRRFQLITGWERSLIFAKGVKYLSVGYCYALAGLVASAGADHEATRQGYFVAHLETCMMSTFDQYNVGQEHAPPSLGEWQVGLIPISHLVFTLPSLSSL